ncbi:2-phospho-L-lactate transferase CofD family protein [Nonomuraea sp. NPDC050691]|uniref:2-phospho-L-lactate transferase CofD family protein n=1 Tax=Nonomuraea sp. NPDC050691 TaxID=3155661 RepID=UPI0033DB4830
MRSRHANRIEVAMFSGGRGGASIARHLLRTPGVGLSLLINGYDNGMSTGALRRYLPGMLGPSDFRKNLLLHLDGSDPRDAALIAVLEYRFPAGSTPRDLDELIDALTPPGRPHAHPGFAALPRRARTAIVRDLIAFRRRLDADPSGFDLADCALGNLVFAGAYLRSGENFNAAVRACAWMFRSPARLVNVTDGENAYLAALKENGRILADEADLVAPQDADAVTDLFLLREPVTGRGQAELDAQSVEEKRRALVGRSATVSPNPEALREIRNADLIVYGPGTPHSSLIPSYLTPGVPDAIAASRARAKVLVVNLREDHDVQGLTAADLVDLTLSYLGDPLNERGTVTHVLCPRAEASRRGVPATPYGLADGATWAGARWIITDLEDPERPGTHHGGHAAAILTDITGITDAATLVQAG